jgi:hypothetical protein
MWFKTLHGEGSALMDAAHAHSLLDGKSPGQRANLNEQCRRCHLDTEMVARVFPS